MDHLPYISHELARTKYEDPNNCKTDPGIELGCAENWKALELLVSFSWLNTNEPIGVFRLFSHFVQKAPSAVITELSSPKSFIRRELNHNSCITQ